jgi:hypothetical protein
MKVFLGSVLVLVALAAAAALILNAGQRPAWEVYSSTQSTRVGDPGHNLVGENWSGNPRPQNS